MQQHVCFSWCVEGDRFEHSGEPEPKRKALYDRINSWLLAIDIEQVDDFIDSLFKLVEITEAKTLTDLKKVKGGELAKKAHSIMQEYSGMNDETKQMLWEMSVFLVEVLAHDRQERLSRWKAIDKMRQQMEH